MKKVIMGKELEEKMEESIHLLCDTVKETLGPIGKNVMIDHSSYSPFITNDGVTIAKNIESEDEVIATILEIAKEASIKTNETVGDGTTTTLVLLQTLFLESKKYIQKGMNPILLKKELEKTLLDILKKLQSKKLEPTEERMKGMAIASANDTILGTTAYEVLKKVKSPLAVTIQETSNNQLEVTYLKGYRFSSLFASFLFLKDCSHLEFHDAYFLLFRNKLEDIERIQFFFNEVLNRKKEFVILAPDFDDFLVEQILSYSKEENLSCALVKVLEYGFKTDQILKDIEVITDAKIVENGEFVTASNVGVVKKITMNKEETKIDFVSSLKIKNYLEQIKQESKKSKDDFDESFYQKRIAMFCHGVALIKLGAPTKIECLEKRMRLEDALCAMNAARKGLLPGSGISLFQIGEELKEEKESISIWKKALKSPLNQILFNAGMDPIKIEEKIKKEHYQILYNILSEKWETLEVTKVVDPYFVVSNTLINACSIVGMLLTTSSLIINEYKNDLNQEKEYTEW